MENPQLYSRSHTHTHHHGDFAWPISYAHTSEYLRQKKVWYWVQFLKADSFLINGKVMWCLERSIVVVAWCSMCFIRHMSAHSQHYFCWQQFLTRLWRSFWDVSARHAQSNSYVTCLDSTMFVPWGWWRLSNFKNWSNKGEKFEGDELQAMANYESLQ